MGWLGQKRGELDDLRAAGQFVGRLEGHGGHGIPKSTRKKERRKLRLKGKREADERGLSAYSHSHTSISPAGAFGT